MYGILVRADTRKTSRVGRLRADSRLEAPLAHGSDHRRLAGGKALDGPDGHPSTSLEPLGSGE
jgi:hypothetical protein